MAVAQVVNWNPHVRQVADFEIVGTGFTAATMRTYPHRTITPSDAGYTFALADQKAEIAAAIDGSYTARKPTTINWASVGSNHSDWTVLSSTKGRVGGISAEGGSNSFCLPFIIRNGDGDSATHILNKPKIWGLPGTNTAKLYSPASGSSPLYTLVGRHMASPNCDPAVFLLQWTSGAVNQNNIHRCTILAGRGGTAASGSTIDRSTAATTIDFEIPAGLTAGSYKLLVFTNENRYGLTDPTALPVTVIASDDPWYTTTSIDTNLLTTLSGADISQALQLRLMVAAATATESAPIIVQLPAGVFFLSHLLALPANVGIRGAGIHATTLMPNPQLRGVDNVSGSLYYSLESYSSANSNCYSGYLSGVFTGDQRVVSSPIMIRVRGSNTLVKDLTLNASPDNHRETLTGCIGAGDGINEGRCINVRFVNHLALNNAQRTIMRLGRWRYWRFQNCEYDCDKAFNPATSPAGTFANNGAFDDSLIEGGHVVGVHGPSAQSAFADLGKGSLMRDVRGANLRRFVAANMGHHCTESAFVFNQLSNQIAQYGAGEAFLIEARECELQTVATATNPGSSLGTYTVSGDSDDRTRQCVHIVDGTGKGQTRNIILTALGVHYVAEWEIIPDNTSKVVVGAFPKDVAFVGNKINGLIGGVTLYGSSAGIEVRDNYLWGTAEGILFSVNHVTASSQCSFAAFNTAHGNWHSDGAGVHLTAVRSAADIATITWPMMVGISVSSGTYMRDCVSQAWCGIGSSEHSADEDHADLTGEYLIDGVYLRGEDYYSDPTKYGHSITCKALTRRYPFGLSNQGIQNFSLRASYVDDVSVSDTTTLYKTTDDFLTVGQTSITDVVNEGLESQDLTDLTADVAALESGLATTNSTVSTLSSTVTTQGTTISGHTTSLSTLNTTVSGHTTTLSAQATTISGHTTSISTLQTDLDAVETEIDGLELEVSPEQIQEIEDSLRADLQSSLPLGINIVRVVNPRATDEGLTIVQGDSYENEYRIRWLDIREVWPSLSGATISFKIDNLDGTNALTQAGSVVSQTDVRVALTSVQTGALNFGAYTYRVIATLADTTTRTLVVGSVVVV